MKKTQKFISAVMVFAVIFAIISNVYAAAINGKIELVYAQVNDQIVVDVKIANLNEQNGLSSFSGILEYDKTNLEFVKMEGQNGWVNPTYNEEDGVFVTDKNTTSSTSLPANNETIFTITFKAKVATASNVKVTIKGIEASNGTLGTMEDSSIDITIGGRATTNSTTNTTTNVINAVISPSNQITIGSSNNVITNSTRNLTNTTNTTPNITANTIADSKLPQTGESDFLFILAGIIFTVGTISFLHLRKISKQENLL